MPTLDKWFVKKDADGEKVEALFTVFYLDGVTMKAEWIREVPKKHTYLTTIKWPALSDDPITLVGNIGREEEDKFSHFNLPSEVIYNNLPYLKSHLQKCIRRSNLNLALKTALHLARLDLQELLRRLAIIMVEDAILLPEFTTLVWFTAAVSKGFSLDKKRIYWLFGLITKLALVNYRDPTWNASINGEGSDEDEVEEEKSKPVTETKPKTMKLAQTKLNYVVATPTPTAKVAVAATSSSSSTTTSTTTLSKPKKKETKNEEAARSWKTWKIYKLKDAEKSVIQSLLFRESYGGMKGDKNMLIDAAKIWYDRFTNESPNNRAECLALDFYREEEKKGPLYVSPPEENLKQTEWILAAIDFHVVNNVVMILADKYETLNYEVIKAAIWHHSSKYTNKVEIGKSEKERENSSKDPSKEKYRKAWNLIRPEFYSLAAYFLKNNH